MPVLPFEFEHYTRPQGTVKRGESRYTLIPREWPEGCRVQVILLPEGDA